MECMKTFKENIRTARELLRTNGVHIYDDLFRGKMMDYIKDRLDIGWTDERPGNTELETGLILLSSEFQRVALFPNNIRRIGRQQVFKDYLQGLPSGLSIPFYYYDMRQDLIRLTGCEDLDCIDDGAIADLFYLVVETAVNDLLEINNLERLDELEVK